MGYGKKKGLSSSHWIARVCDGDYLYLHGSINHLMLRMGKHIVSTTKKSTTDGSVSFQQERKTVL